MNQGVVLAISGIAIMVIGECRFKKNDGSWLRFVGFVMLLAGVMSATLGWLS